MSGLLIRMQNTIKLMQMWFSLNQISVIYIVIVNA